MPPPSSWFAEVGPDGFWRVFDADSVIIASHCVREDAHLIAAAPHLLAACRTFVRLAHRNKEALAAMDGFSALCDAMNATVDKAIDC
ncbi:hypothetical protein AUJ46_01275 [Candidatus Peregrinibacteria bacterium CG1_02_54_53]|nr:MAG: hypothetical protein AUJ46_01275 [Candidatus Peregrinibacteria bacterium CG1_02_54_53]